ncbi:MAG: hypothetical protein AB1705_15315 [Verrucomicrobiota bacterium]
MERNMNSTRLGLLLLTFLLIAPGCATQDMVVTPGYAGPAKVTRDRMAEHMQYRGFAILRPADPRWYFRYGEQNPLTALFRLEVSSPAHSFFGSVRHQRLPTAPGTPGAFKEYVDAEMKRLGPRHELVAYESEVTTLQGQPCVRYKQRVWDRAAVGADEPLLMTVVGFHVIHPTWERTVIVASYSERVPKDEVAGNLDGVGADFLSRVVLESAPGVKLK